MKRLILIFILSLSTVISLFSQNTYPSKFALNGDTIIAISPIQLITINEKLSELDSLKLYTSNLEDYVSLEQRLIDRQISINKTLSEKNVEILDQLDNLTKITTVNNNMIEYLNREIDVQKRKKRASFFGGTLVGVSTTSILILILK